MVLNKETEKLFNKLKELCKDQLTEAHIVKRFKEAQSSYDFKYLVMKDYIDKLDFLRKGLL